MVNKVINLNKNDAMYNEIMGAVNAVTDDDLVIVGRSYKNRKDDSIKPINIKNGIYFYVAYDLDGKTIYPSNITQEQIYKAKKNMINRARIGSFMEILSSGGKPISDFEYTGDPMITVTLDCRTYGAGILYCDEFIRSVRKKIGNYYILPSSIHELIFVPDGIASKYELTTMVQDVNKTQVSENEFLADVAFEMIDWM